MAANHHMMGRLETVGDTYETLPLRQLDLILNMLWVNVMAKQGGK